MTSAGVISTGALMGGAALLVAALVMPALHVLSPPVERERASAAVEAQLARGARLYGSGCATAACHGVRGEGVRAGAAFRAWPLVGPRFQARNPTAQVVFDVVRSGREPALRALTDHEIYDAIAYEMTLNGARLATPITMRDAAARLTGPQARAPAFGEIHPPPANMLALPPAGSPRGPPPPAENGHLRLRADQMARARAIGDATVPGAGAFAVLVVSFEALTDRPIALDPAHLRLDISGAAPLAPRDVELDYPIDRFRAQTITPGHGTAAVAIFALPPRAAPARLVYDDATGHPLSVDLDR
jgi:mono/diheme cytochrome c family protein